MSILGGGTINITATPSGGVHVDARAVIGSIIPDVSGVYSIGSAALKFSHIFATSGIFGDGTTTITDVRVSTPLVACDNILATNDGTTLGALNGISTNGSYVGSLFGLETERTANSAFEFINCLVDRSSSPDAVFRVVGDGGLFSDIAAPTPADYAEYFETQDPAGIDMGLGVKLNSNGLLEVADLADKIIGFVSAAPGMITDAAWGHWHNKYLKTEFGAYQLDKNGDRTLNRAWDSEVSYIPRGNRPEWVAVGVLGKIWVRTGNQVLVPGDLVKIDNNGLVTSTPDTENSWQVITAGLAYDSDRGYGTVRILYK